MSRRLLALLALPLLLAAVLLVLAQAYPTPLVASTGFGELAFSAHTQAAPHERAPAGCCDVSFGSPADLSSEEPEPPQATAPATRAATGGGQWLAAASTPWPSRAPDELLRPPTALPRV